MDETAQTKDGRPSWLSWANLAAGIQVAAIVGGLAFWAVTTATQANTTAVGLTAVSLKLDRLSDKMGEVPVMGERLRQIEIAVQEAKANWSLMDTRMRAIEIEHDRIRNMREQKAQESAHTSP